MNILLKKALRAIWRNKKTYIACIILIMLGVMMYVSFGIAGNALQTAKVEFYATTNFADVFAGVRGISRAQADGLRIDGITDVSARVVLDSQVYIEDSDAAITLRLLSRNQDPLNQIQITGADIADDFDILMNQSFLDAWDLAAGDEVSLIINNRLIAFTVRGVFSSPEYLYIVDEGGSILPDEATFNAAVVSESTLLALNDSLFNDLSFALAPGVRFSDVELALEDALQRFGLISLIPQEDQLSNAVLTMEIDYIVSIGNSVPMAFIFMSIIILYLMLKRIIEQERPQIGTLKAFGYTKKQILVSYAFYGALTGAIGGILGVSLGILASDGFLTLFGEFFKLPNLVRAGTLQFSAVGLIMAIAGGAAGSIMGAKSTLKLQPAESMRPVVPNIKHKVRSAFKWLPATSQMAIRSMSRNKVRSAFIVFGMMFSFGFLTFMASFSTMIDDVILSTYNKIQVYDGKISFNDPVRNAVAVSEIERIPGITHAEAIIELPARISLANRHTATILTGIAADSSLLRIYDTDRSQTFPPPENGIILINALATELGAQRGNYVTINDNKVRVVEIVQQGMGAGAYLEKKFLGDIMEFTGGSTAVLFNAYDMSEIRRIAREGANVRSLDDQAHTRRLVEDMLRPYASVFYILLILGIIIAFAICYNTASIALMERKREYATLRVVGMHTKEIANILSFEYWILAACGIILGIPLPRAMLIAINNMMADMDMFSLSTYVPLQAYIIGIVCMLAAVYLSNRSNIRSVRKMEMVTVLKERE